MPALRGVPGKNIVTQTTIMCGTTKPFCVLPKHFAIKLLVMMHLRHQIDHLDNLKNWTAPVCTCRVKKDGLLCDIR